MTSQLSSQAVCECAASKKQRLKNFPDAGFLIPDFISKI